MAPLMMTRLLAVPSNAPGTCITPISQQHECSQHECRLRPLTPRRRRRRAFLTSATTCWIAMAFSLSFWMIVRSPITTSTRYFTRKEQQQQQQQQPSSKKRKQWYPERPDVTQDDLKLLIQQRIEEKDYVRKERQEQHQSQLLRQRQQPVMHSSRIRNSHIQSNSNNDNNNNSRNELKEDLEVAETDPRLTAIERLSTKYNITIDPKYNSRYHNNNNDTIDFSTIKTTILSRKKVRKSQPTNYHREAPKVLLFLTTIFSDYHIQMFHCCWPPLLQQSTLLKNVHVLLFSNNETEVPVEELDHVRHLFRHNPSFHFQFASPEHVEAIAQMEDCNDQFQRGANLGPQLAFERDWFRTRSHSTVSIADTAAGLENNTNNSRESGNNNNNNISDDDVSSSDYYDWVIRINPDVLIRRSTWLQSIMRDKNVDAVVIDCGTKRMHTDFFMVRPEALINQWKHQSNDVTVNAAADNYKNGTHDNEKEEKENSEYDDERPFSQMQLEPWNKPYPINRTLNINHEATATHYFRPLLRQRRHRYLPKAGASNGICRVRGRDSPVHHDHDSCQADPNVCDALQGFVIN